MPPPETPAKWAVLSCLDTDMEDVPNSTSFPATCHQRFTSKSAADTWAKEYSGHFPELRVFVMEVPEYYYVGGQDAGKKPPAEG